MRFATSTLIRALGGFVVVMAMSFAQVGQAATPQDAIVGTWLTEDGGSKVDVVASRAADGSTSYSGRVSWLKDPMRDGKPLRDANNDDAALRDRPILGLEILSGFKAAGAGTWTGGTLYSPRRGESFPADLSLLPDGSLELKVKAGFMTKTVRWTR
jgi:uncharacterized protein (DUF2147 family)